MFIIDSHDWTKPKRHLRLLKDKVNNYLNFYKTKSYEAVDPAYVGREVVIVLILQYPPAEIANDMLWHIREVATGMGCHFICEVHDESDGK
ncbi:MAG: DUF6572 domain-containing protein [Fimbriiglobus sp.]